MARGEFAKPGSNAALTVAAKKLLVDLIPFNPGKFKANRAITMTGHESADLIDRYVFPIDTIHKSNLKLSKNPVI